MLSSKEANNKIEKLHKRALQIIHNNYDSTLDCHDLLQKDKSVTIHKKNLQFLMTEIFKTLHDANPSFMKEIIGREDTRHNLKCMDILNVPRVNSNTYGICFLMNLRLYQVCPPIKIKQRAGMVKL